MTHVVHIGDRAPIVMTDTSTGKTRRFGEEGEETVEVRSLADADLLVSNVPGAYLLDPEPETETPPSTPSGRGRGRNQP